jgi:uncharacterized protein (TIGR02444 family)
MTKSAPSEVEAESWAFALDIYARPGVADACLRLQNEAGVDVMLLLIATFAAVKRRNFLSPDALKSLDEACGPWREQIVSPLRKIRSGLKSGPSPAPCEETEQFRSKIKTIELAAERLQNRLLAEALRLGPPEREPASPERLSSVLVEVVNLYATRRGEKLEGRLLSPIETIVEASLAGTS